MKVCKTKQEVNARHTTVKKLMWSFEDVEVFLSCWIVQLFLWIAIIQQDQVHRCERVLQSDYGSWFVRNYNQE